MYYYLTVCGGCIGEVRHIVTWQVCCRGCIGKVECIITWQVVSEGVPGKGEVGCILT